MQRFEPRELVAAGVCAALPAIWWFGAAHGGPDVLDSDSGAGAVVATAVVREWLTGPSDVGTAGSFGTGTFFPAAPLLSGIAAILPVEPLAATRLVVALALWTCGFGGWRLAREVAPGSGLVGGFSIAIATQIAAGRATLEADLPAFTAGFLLLALAHARTGMLVGAMGLPATSAVLTIGLVRRRPWLMLGVVGLAGLLVGPSELPGSARRTVRAAPSVPAYGTLSGAWFPMPPAEAAAWKNVEGRGELWLSPRSSLLVGDQPPAPFVGGAGAAPASVDAQRAPQTLGERVLSSRADLEARIDSAFPIVGEERRAVGRGTVVSPLGAVLLFLALRGCERRKWGRFVPVVAGALALAGSLLVWLREVRHDEGVGGHDLATLAAELRPLGPAGILFFPPAKSPYFAGRLSADRQLGFCVAAGKPDALVDSGPAVALLGELGRKSEYGLDVSAAERFWTNPAGESPIHDAWPAEFVVIDQKALATPAFRLVSGWLEQSVGAPAASEGDLVVYALK